MKIKWYGHSAFRLTTQDGVSIIIDPYESGAFDGAVAYGPITDQAEIVLVSHDHADHNFTGTIGASLKVVTSGEYDFKGVKIAAIPVHHDASRGKERGNNLIFVVEADGLRIAHLGDLGHLLGQDALTSIGRVDVLLLPIGGVFTIDPKEATEVMNAIGPSITLPMHYKTPKIGFPLASVDDFVQGKSNVRRANAPETEVTSKSLPERPEIVLLRFAN